jgi:hypothetical protein
MFLACLPRKGRLCHSQAGMTVRRLEVEEQLAVTRVGKSVLVSNVRKSQERETHGSSPGSPYCSVSSGYLSNKLASPIPPLTGGTYGASMSFLARRSQVTSANHAWFMTSRLPPCKLPRRLVKSCVMSLVSRSCASGWM